MTAIEIHRNAPSRDDAPRAGFPMALLFWAHVAGVSAGIAAGVGGGFGVFASGGAWVGTSLCGIALLVIGSIILVLATLIFDVGSLMGSLADPATTLVGA